GRRLGVTVALETETVSRVEGDESGFDTDAHDAVEKGERVGLGGLGPRPAVPCETHLEAGEGSDGFGTEGLIEVAYPGALIRVDGASGDISEDEGTVFVPDVADRRRVGHQMVSQKSGVSSSAAVMRSWSRARLSAAVW